MYHYTACGLDNVWLANGYVERNTAYGKAVSVTKAQELHQLLACDLVRKRGNLTGKELRFLRVQMGLSQAGFAGMQGVSEQAVSLWERTGKVPFANDRLTRMYYLAHVDGKTPLSKAIERLKTIESLVHQRIVARASKTGSWSSKVTDEEYALAA